MYTYQLEDKHLEGGIVVGLCAIQVDEEEDVRPHVVLVTHVVVEPLHVRWAY